MVGKCAVDKCEAKETQRHYVDGHTDALGRSLLLIIDLCDVCRFRLEKENIKALYNYYRCGGLGFVERIMPRKTDAHYITTEISKVTD